MIREEKNPHTELTILMPCLNESETVSGCAEEALFFIASHGLNAEVLIADNGSNDGSPDMAESAGARVIIEKERGYGNALAAGITAACGKYIIMCDADGSYDMGDILPILDLLRSGYDLVVGDRFSGGIEQGAMPFLHRYIGNPLLSAMGRFLYKSRVRDFHCGLRGFDREKITWLDLKSPGFEYASEMIIRAEMSGLKIGQVPVRLKCDGRVAGHSHIRSVYDGLAHVRMMLSLKGKIGKS